MEFEELYHEHKNRVYNLALQYVQNTFDAEEICQDVFLTVHEKLPSFRNESTLNTWIYRITINKSLDYIKSKKRKKRFGIFTTIFHSETVESEKEFISFDHPGVLIEHREDIERIFRFINDLPESQRTALLLNKVEGLSIPEIAEIMQLNTKATESVILRAKNNLKNKIIHAKE